MITPMIHKPLPSEYSRITAPKNRDTMAAIQRTRVFRQPCSFRCTKLHWALFSSSSAETTVEVEDLLQNLRLVDTSALCDADKTLRGQCSNDRTTKYAGIKLMDGERILPMNHYRPTTAEAALDCSFVMAGVARTVQFTEPNDFLPVLRGLQEAEKDEVLVVNTMDSVRAVAGEIFSAEAHRKGLAGIIIDGPVRDVRHLSKYPPLRVYAASTSPYSGTTQSVGEMQQPIICGGVEVVPGEILVGNEDGVVVGSAATFQQILPMAQQIQSIEGKLLEGITSDSNKSVATMSNFNEHLEKRRRGDPSNLEFKV